MLSGSRFAARGAEIVLFFKSQRNQRLPGCVLSLGNRLGGEMARPGARVAPWARAAREGARVGQRATRGCE